MTALLTADEAARLTLGVNVIVRSGDRNDGPLPPFNPAAERTWKPIVAPKAWLALTGPCPTCGGVKPEHSTCGEHWNCVGLGATPFGPYCRDGRRIVPLYRECLQTWTAENIVCAACGGTGRVLVGRGSIEVVPVAMIVLGPRPYSVFQRDDRALVWRGAHPDEVTNRFLGYWPNDKPAPGPGRDFGIVINCVELVLTNPVV